MITPRDGRLPDLAAMAAAVHAVGDPFRLRGVEAVIDGDLCLEAGHLVLRLPGTLQDLSLAPLRRKVQWDAAGKREQPAAERERTAYADLVARWRGTARRVRVVGPLVPRSNDGRLVLEVRQVVRPR